MSEQQAQGGSTDPTEMVTRGEVQQSFAQVDQHIQGLAKMFNHNGQAVQQGFLSNDIWLATMKNALLDMAATQKVLCEQAGIEPEHKTNEQGALDLETYWEEAQTTVRSQMEEQQKLRDATPDSPVVAGPGSDEELVEFGGDHAAEQAEASTTTP